MPAKSEAQRRLVYATLGGAKTGMPKAVAKEFAAADPGGKLPERKAKLSYQNSK